MSVATKRSLVPIVTLAIAGMALVAGCGPGAGEKAPIGMGQERPAVAASGAAGAAPGASAALGTTAAARTSESPVTTAVPGTAAAPGTSAVPETTAAPGTSAATETAAPSKAGGTLYETKMFSILVPDGWKTTDLSYEQEYLSDIVAVMITKGEDVMSVAMDIDPYVSNPKDYTAAYPDADAMSKELAENTMEQNGGTPLEVVTMLDVGFFKTSVTVDGKDTTAFVGARDGRVVSILMAGKDNQQNPELKAMLESIKFK